ncbi:zinc metalloproteinase nas-13-like [Planococcus citri]|uniref:zinc metalloproteinase nas-13-like n=1 Tax=Planococcus citri TaxID=170843 RepID=UPI0031F800A0
MSEIGEVVTPVEHGQNLIFRDLEQFKTGLGIVHHRVPRGVIWDQSKRWPSPIIPYEISSHMSDVMNRKIKKTMEYMESKTCLKFKQRARKKVDYIFFQDDESGCYSKLGRQGSKQIVNLKIPGCDDESTIQHEIMHALGFDHEHQRIDRDEYIRVRFNNIEEEAEDQFEKEESDTMGLPYDFYSVMHYSSDLGSKNHNEPVLVPKVIGIGLIGDNELDELDIKKINMLFNCTKHEEK